MCLFACFQNPLTPQALFVRDLAKIEVLMKMYCEGACAFQCVVFFFFSLITNRKRGLLVLIENKVEMC